MKLLNRNGWSRQGPRVTIVVVSLTVLGTVACGRRDRAPSNKSTERTVGAMGLLSHKTMGLEASKGPRARPGGSAGERSLIRGLAKLQKRLAGTWLVYTGQWPPVPEIWSVNGAKVTRIDREMTKTTGSVLVQSPCRMIVAGQPLQVRFDDKGFRITDKPLLARSGGDLLACVRQGTIWHKDGQCTLYPDEVVKGRGRIVPCKVSRRGKQVVFGATVPDKQAPQKKIIVRLAVHAKTLFPAEQYHWATKPVADAATAEKQILLTSQRYILPYGLWFGMSIDQLTTHLAAGYYGGRICTPPGGDPGPAAVWDQVPLPYLGLPVQDCSPKMPYQKGRSELTEIRLWLRMSYSQASTRRLFAAATRRMTGLLRRPPRRKKTKSGTLLSWTVAGIRVEIEHHDRPTGGGPESSAHHVWIRFKRQSGYQAPAPADRWKHPARRRKGYPWHRGKPFAYHPEGLRMGHTIAQVQARLRKRNRRFVKTKPPTGRYYRFTETAPITAGAQQWYECRLAPFGQRTYKGYCVFRRGKLGLIMIPLLSSQVMYDQRLLIQQLHQRLVRRFGKNPDQTPVSELPQRRMTWTMKDNVVVVAELAFLDAGPSDYHVMLYVTPQ